MLWCTTLPEPGRRNYNGDSGTEAEPGDVLVCQKSPVRWTRVQILSLSALSSEPGRSLGSSTPANLLSPASVLRRPNRLRALSCSPVPPALIYPSSQLFCKTSQMPSMSWGHGDLFFFQAMTTTTSWDRLHATPRTQPAQGMGFGT